MKIDDHFSYHKGPLVVKLISRIKQSVRAKIVRLNTISEDWVIPESYWDLVDSEQYQQASIELKKIAKQWPDDPHVTYADAMLYTLAPSCGHSR